MHRILLAGLAAVLTLAAADTNLPDAVMQGDTAAVRSLLQRKTDVNAAQGDGMTALHWAAFRDDLDTARLLLAAGANIEAATREGAITPLFLACTNGNAAMIEALLKAGASANSVKSNTTTALMTAAASGSVDAVKILLERGAAVDAKESAHGQTALMFAAALNRHEVVKLLLTHHASANIATAERKVDRVRFDQDGNIVEERPAAARPAARTTAEADKADEAADAQAAADAAKAARTAAAGDLDALGHALGFAQTEPRFAAPKPRAGDVAARAPRRVGPEMAGGMSALLYAAREGHLETVKALVEGGANLNQLNADKFTPLVEAVVNGHLDLAKYLVEKGADPNLATLSGLTALYAVIDVQWAPHAWFPQPSTEQEHVSYLDLMKLLIDRGANVNAPINEKLWFRSYTNDYTWVDPAGATPFWRAAQSSDIAAMKLLVEHGADTKTATKSGVTPLMAAAGIGWAANWSVNAPIPFTEAVRYSIELGNDVNAVENRGYTALHGAAYLGNNDMIQYLVGKGARVDVKSKAGDTVADMANGPTRFGQPHPESVALLEKLGSGNSHNCRSDQCVIAPRAVIYNRTLSAAEQADKDRLDQLAVALGFESAIYLSDAPDTRRPGGQ